MIYLVLLLQLLVILLILWQNKKPNSPGANPKARFVVDTSSLIDGRLEAIIKNGFLPGVLIIPTFVVAELQHIADSNNELRRTRGRNGLELVSRLQAGSVAEVKVVTNQFKSIEKVDDKLVALAKRRRAAILTTDYNLNRVATIQNVQVLNVNELAHALRPIVLPGEEITVRLIQRGSDAHQGVGYLEDGTMIVVDHASALINKDVRVKVTRIMQTVAGKMLFASKMPAMKK